MRATNPTGKKFNEYLAALIDNSDLKQNEISERLGYTNANMISMIKTGKTKLPLEKVPAFAEAVGVDPAHLLRLILKEYAPEVLDVLNKTLGVSVTQHETQILKVIRKATKESDPAIDADTSKKLEALFKG